LSTLLATEVSNRSTILWLLVIAVASSPKVSKVSGAAFTKFLIVVSVYYLASIACVFYSVLVAYKVEALVLVSISLMSVGYTDVEPKVAPERIVSRSAIISYFSFNADCVAFDIGLLISDVLSTLLRPMLILVMFMLPTL
jgi:hypothetical protein